jgi:hypothetical protein
MISSLHCCGLENERLIETIINHHDLNQEMLPMTVLRILESEETFADTFFSFGTEISHHLP